VLSLGLAAVAVAVLAFTTWHLFLQPRGGMEAGRTDVAAPTSIEEGAAGSAANGGVTTPAEPAPSTPVEEVPTAPLVAGPELAPAVELPPPAVVPPAPSAAGSSRPTSAARPAAPVSRPTSPPTSAPGAPVATASLVAGLAAEPVAAKPAALDAREGEGSLSLGSTPRAQIMIDGAYVRYTPIFQYNLPAGVHTVVLVTDDGRRKSFRVEVGEGKEARKVWLFDESRWAEGDDVR
jgi:hypothetical protein